MNVVRMIVPSFADSGAGVLRKDVRGLAPGIPIGHPMQDPDTLLVEPQAATVDLTVRATANGEELGPSTGSLAK